MAEKSPKENRRRPDRKLSGSRQDTVGSSARKARNLTRDLESGTATAVGAMFRSAREAQKLSQDQVAALTSGQTPPISRATISSIERGKSLPGLEVLTSLSEVLHVDPTEVLDLIKVQSPPVDLSGVTRKELTRQAEESFWAGDYRRALATYDAILHHLLLDPPEDENEQVRVRAKVEIDRANTLRQCSALRAARAAAERATQLASGIGDLQSQAYMILASLYSYEGLLALAQDAADRAVALVQGGSPRLLGLAWDQKGNILYRVKKFEEARDAFLRAREFAEEGQDHRTVASAEGNAGACLAALGRKSGARKHFNTAVNMARKHGDPAAEAFWLLELGRLALSEGTLDEADRYVGDALRIARPSDRVLTIFRAVWLQRQGVRRRGGKDPDRHRQAFLRKLYTRVKVHKGVDEIEEFEREFLGSRDQPRRPA